MRGGLGDPLDGWPLAVSPSSSPVHSANRSGARFGYHVRLDRRNSDATRILGCDDQWMCSCGRMQSDPLLEARFCVILDDFTNVVLDSTVACVTSV